MTARSVQTTVTLAWRETRGAWRHFLYVVVSIALGVGALVGIGLFSEVVERTVSREAKSLLGGDVEVRLSRRLSDGGIHALAAVEFRGVQIAHLSELAAMAAVAGRSQLVELKAVDPRYPLYGDVRTDPPAPLAVLLRPEAGAHGAIVQEALLIKLGIGVGDRLSIGETQVRVTAVLRHEPDRVATAFSLGPRVLISRDALDAAALVRPGSRVRERYLLRLPPAMEPAGVVAELRGALEADSARVSGFREAQPQLRRFLQQLTRYLGLIGLTALLIGGLGISSTVHAFIKEKSHTIAILKSIGANSSTIIAAYVLQALVLALLGSAIGIAIGVGVRGALPSLLAGFVPVDLTQHADTAPVAALWPIAQGILLGLLTALLFTIWPLLAIRDIRPAQIFRREDASLAPASLAQRFGTWWKDRVRLGTALFIIAGLVALSLLQARSWLVGGLFAAGLLAAVVILRVSAWVVMRVIARGLRLRSLAGRYAIRNLQRPGSQAAGVIMSIGIAVMLIVAVSLLERSLVNQIGESRPVEAPTFFFIDIQPDQADAFSAAVHQQVPGADLELTPLVRSRLYSIDGVRVKPDDDAADPGRDRADGRDQEHQRAWFVSREYVLTSLETLPKDNKIVAGTWWSPGERPREPIVSVEEDAARHLGLTVGSMIEVDIQGVPVAARVGSIRSVEWSNFSTNFYMILSPGALDGVPYTYVGTVHVPPEQEVPLQQGVVAAFPNVSAINIGEVMDSFARILEHLSLAIRAVALFCILTGAVVMAAAVATTRYRRLYESVVLKALGATRGIIARAFAVEYALMGAVAGAIGVVLASVLTAGVLHWVFDLNWRLHPDVLALGLLLTMLLAVTVGFFGTFRILGEKPLAILRHE